MRSLWQWATLALAAVAAASEIQLDQKPENRQKCAGMYGKASWGGDVDPFILATFAKQNGSSSVVSLVLYEYEDYDLIGVTINVPTREGIDRPEMQYQCNNYAIARSACNETEYGQFILKPNATEHSKSPLVTTAIHLDDPTPLKYMISRTGYYCIAIEPVEGEFDYSAVVEFRNAYGELAAAQIAKLPFYGGLTLVYAVIGIFWGFLYVQNRHDILPVQNYITAIIVFLVLEMLLTWGYYDFENVHGSTVGAKAFLIVVAILNAARNSFSLFLLLIVCMGYGVVKPSLGRVMLWVRGLAAAHFVFCVVYTIASMVIHPEEAGIMVLFIILPLSATLTAFYIWTLNSLGATMKDLVERKQHVKAGMYRKLWWCILTTIVVIFGFFFFNSFSFMSVSNENFVPTHWQGRWFVLDGWLNIVYLADVIFISYLWRPTPNNRRFAMSDELAQDDEGFEINSIGDSLGDSDIEDEAGMAKHTPPESGPSSTGTTGESTLAPSSSQHHRSVSPLPAPKPQRPSSLPKASLEGETLFAVGDEERWSEEHDDEERDGLMKKS